MEFLNDDDDEAGEAASGPPWRVLVVDDAPDVHETTRLALRGTVFHGRGVELLHAESKAEAQHMLRQVPHIAVALVDVVMETEHAGLELVDWIRTTLKNHTIRLVLRTGQPGYAPESDIIVRYEIDDYKQKAELTRTRLATTLLAGLRNYERQDRLEWRETRLHHLIGAVGTLFQAHTRRTFCQRLLVQLATFLHTAPEGMVVARQPSSGDTDGGTQSPARWSVMAAMGPWSDLSSAGLQAGTFPREARAAITACLEAETEVVRADGVCLYLTDADGEPAIAWLPGGAEAADTDPEMLHLFALNAGAGYHRVSLVRDLEMANGELRRRTTELLQALTDARAADEAKMRFLSTISHELCTPINAILGLAEVIRDQRMGDHIDAYTGYAADIYRSGQHLQELVNDVLDMSRLESGCYSLHEETINTGELLNQCGRMLQPRANRGGIELEVPDTGPAVTADERALRQVLINLLTNAVKFTPAGGHVRVTTEVREDGWLAVRVSDSGEGIPRDKLARVFEPFEHVQGQRSGGQQEGTGLGLAISRRLMQLHDGELTLDSTPGEGTTATMFLPPQRVHAAKQMASAS